MRSQCLYCGRKEDFPEYVAAAAVVVVLAVGSDQSRYANAFAGGSDLFPEIPTMKMGTIPTRRKRSRRLFKNQPSRTIAAIARPRWSLVCGLTVVKFLQNEK